MICYRIRIYLVLSMAHNSIRWSY